MGGANFVFGRLRRVPPKKVLGLRPMHSPSVISAHSNVAAGWTVPRKTASVVYPQFASGSPWSKSRTKRFTAGV